ncbi:hypothetical protein FLK61_40010 [Paenalkalicoccus suaedae]|uniref:Uncharacterized protein n=2 Tax=Paenalkalicoccus suaedae TaxID=2592382 RepID=A0A859FI23_9BACI|nr:hypothetical protein FLK61_40010 [Paenalkalicoccus suaedae]
MSTIAIVALAGCANEEVLEPIEPAPKVEAPTPDIPSVDLSFQAIVTEANDTLLIDALNGEYHPSPSISTYQLISETTGENVVMEELEVGDYLEVTYNGRFEQSNPPGIFVSDVTSIDAPIIDGWVKERGTPLVIGVSEGSFHPEEGATSYNLDFSEAEVDVTDWQGRNITADKIYVGNQIRVHYGGSSKSEDMTTIKATRLEDLREPTFEARVTTEYGTLIEVLDNQFRPDAGTWYGIIDQDEDSPDVFDENDQEITLADLEIADVVEVTFLGGFQDSEPLGLFAKAVRKLDKPQFEATVMEVNDDVLINIAEDEYLPSDTSTYELTGKEQNLVVLNEAQEEIHLLDLQEGATIEVTYEGTFNLGTPSQIFAHKVQVVENE